MNKQTQAKYKGRNISFEPKTKAIIRTREQTTNGTLYSVRPLEETDVKRLRSGTEIRTKDDKTPNSKGEK